MKHICIWLTGVVLFSLVTACSGGSGTPATPSPTASTPTTPPAAVPPGSSPVSQTTATTAASGTGPGVAAPSSQRACRLVTRAEVEAATGLTFTDGTFTPGGLVGGTCFYEQQRAQPSDLADLVGVQPFTGTVVYDELRADTRAQEVPGLGDRAFTSPGQVVVLKGNRGVIISWDRVTGTPVLSDAEKRERLITLARAAVGRL